MRSMILAAFAAISLTAAIASAANAADFRVSHAADHSRPYDNTPAVGLRTAGWTVVAAKPTRAKDTVGLRNSRPYCELYSDSGAAEYESNSVLRLVDVLMEADGFIDFRPVKERRPPARLLICHSIMSAVSGSLWPEFDGNWMVGARSGH
jgi:hypothetical protein